jgi:cytochrome c
LVGGFGTLSNRNPTKTVGSYWPYATTLFDFVRRAMPFNAPGTLSDDEVYAVSAYILALNGVIGDDATLGPDNLPDIRMPNRNGFISEDPRPDVR